MHVLYLKLLYKDNILFYLNREIGKQSFGILKITFKIFLN